MSQAPEVAQNFTGIKSKFEKDTNELISSLIESGKLGAGDNANPSNNSESAKIDEPRDDPAVDRPLEFESFDKLNQEDEVTERAASDENDAELLLGKSGSTYVMSKKAAKTIAKYSIIGGHGPGRYAPQDESGTGISVAWPSGDQTMILVDQSGLKDSTAVTPETLYRYIVQLEKTKRVTQYKLSYTNIERHSQDGTDGFKVEVKTPMKYVPQGPDPKLSSKNWFSPSGKAFAKLENSQYLQSLFKFKFERVQVMTKIAKPYVVASTAIMLSPGKPVKAGR